MTQLLAKSIREILEDIKSLNTDTILVIADEDVWDIYQHQMAFEVEFADKNIHLFKAVAGERTKSFFEFEAGVEFFLEKKIHRQAHLIVLGGGATSDFAGFVAASLLRGISWSVIPTTLLSMVDASIGGKVAINSVFGKNLVGAFHKPKKVYFNTSFLHSLPAAELLSGQGELLKYGFLSQQIYDDIINEGPIDDIIMNCAEFKLNITEKDFKESGKRKYLNLGHTIGHAIEKYYTLSHGASVILGMAVLFVIFGQNQFLDNLKLMIAKLGIKGVNIPWKEAGFDIEELFHFIEKDKKVLDMHTIELVMLKSIGAPYLLPMQLKDLKLTIKNNLVEVNNLEF